MPNWLPEGTLVLPSDDEMRTAAKWCQLLLNANGNKPTIYPEGCIPLPGDDYAKLLKKINRLQQT